MEAEIGDPRRTDVTPCLNLPMPTMGEPATRTSVELRVEVFNVFNRANFGVPNLVAFAGAADGEAPLGSFGRIRNTVTSARQVQLGVRVRF